MATRNVYGIHGWYNSNGDIGGMRLSEIEEMIERLKLCLSKAKELNQQTKELTQQAKELSEQANKFLDEAEEIQTKLVKFNLTAIC